MARLVWHVEAVADLNAAGEFIARDSVALGAHFVQRVRQSARRLQRYPSLGRMVPEIGNASIRELQFQNYRIVYKRDEDEVTVLAVLHGAMDIERQAAQREWDVT